MTYFRCQELIKANLLSDDEMFENPRFKIILEQCLAMYDSSCHAKYTLSMTVFRETVRTLGTQRHEHILDLNQKQEVRAKHDLSGKQRCPAPRRFLAALL